MLAPLHELAGGRVRVETFPADLLDRPGHSACRELARRLRQARPRLVHAVEIWPAAQVAARLAGAHRLLVTHHTPELPRGDSLAGRLWLRLGWLARPEVVYTSETDRRTDGRRMLRAHVVPLGIDLDRFLAAEPALAKDGPLVGNVARLAPQKGHDVLLEAARLVLERCPEARFVVAGGGELRHELEERARRLGLGEAVRFLGERDDVPGVLASLDVFAFPSRFEGLCLAVIEAQAAGVPVVATPVGGIRETVVPDETGLLVPVDDAAALAEAVVHLLENREAALRMAAAARRRVVECYSEERMVAGTLALYA